MKKNFFLTFGPGILIAATGVGAGDLATAAFTGAKLGLAVLWAVLLGAFFKYVLNEGLTRWQLATGQTLLEGVRFQLGRVFIYTFLIYFLIWSFMVAAALMSASGVALHAIVPVFKDPSSGKIIFGILQSMLGVLIIHLGGYNVFEKIMSLCIGLMFITVVITAILLMPSWFQVLKSLLIPTIPQIEQDGLSWTIALMGGVGGTVTILCYGYWIREQGRFDAKYLLISRLDLASAYIMTAIFGISMVIIGSTIQVDGRGATLIIQLADRLIAELGLAGKLVFLIGTWSAIFSSLLGVWQSVPYIFSDLLRLIEDESPQKMHKIDTTSSSYRGYLYALALIPMIGLWIGFAQMQKLYAVIGALFIPMLALALMLLNGKIKFIGYLYLNRLSTTLCLMAILLFFLLAGGFTIKNVLNF
jgi:Mn2+/Fe2+ NRAMP family transporter